jgi:hypothetical protein
MLARYAASTADERARDAHAAAAPAIGSERRRNEIAVSALETGHH